MSKRVGFGNAKSRSIERLLVGAGSPGAAMAMIDGVGGENEKPSDTFINPGSRVRPSAGLGSGGQGEAVEELEDDTEAMSGAAWGIGEALGTPGKLDFHSAGCECMFSSHDR
jgi:hypothetical protein